VALSSSKLLCRGVGVAASKGCGMHACLHSPPVVSWAVLRRGPLGCWDGVGWPFAVTAAFSGCPT
jgi:hypothetical protein